MQSGPDNMVLKIEVLEPLQVNHLTTHPHPDGSKRRIWLELVVSSPHMLLVIISTFHDGSVHERFRPLPLGTTPVCRMVIAVDTSSWTRVF